MTQTLDDRAKEEADLLLDCAERYESLNISPAQACKLSTLIADQATALKLAQERLEIPEGAHDNFPDGISCRDETIKLLEEQLKEAQERVEELESEMELRKELNISKLEQALSKE